MVTEVPIKSQWLQGHSALEVACTHCGVDVNAQCVAKSGNTTQVHAKRVRLAEQTWPQESDILPETDNDELTDVSFIVYDYPGVESLGTVHIHDVMDEATAAYNAALAASIAEVEADRSEPQQEAPETAYSDTYDMRDEFAFPSYTRYELLEILTTILYTLGINSTVSMDDFYAHLTASGWDCSDDVMVPRSEALKACTEFLTMTVWK